MVVAPIGPSAYRMAIVDTRPRALTAEKRFALPPVCASRAMTVASNDDDRRAPLQPEPDPHGRAALLLAESLLHSLIAASVLTLNDALEAVAVACEANIQTGALNGGSPMKEKDSLALLNSIAASLTTDI